MRNQWFPISQNLKNLINYLLYLLFFVYLGYLVMTEQTTGARLVFLVMLVTLGSVVVVYELLKHWSVQATLALTQRCDPQTGLTYLDKIQKLDIFRSFRTFALVFKTLAIEDQGRPEDLLAWLEEIGEKKFSTSLDLRLVYLHSLFRANLLLNRKEATRDYYQATMNLKDKKILTKKISPLYAWDQIVAEYQLFCGGTREARKSLAKVSCANLNPRERAYYDLLDARICLKEQAVAAARTRLTAVVTAAGQTGLAAEAAALLAAN